MTAQKIKRGKTVALKANTFTRTGYKFAGWNTKKNGSGEDYTDRQKVQIVFFHQYCLHLHFLFYELKR